MSCRSHVLTGMVCFAVDYLIAFIATGDPNSPPASHAHVEANASADCAAARPSWLQWTAEEPHLLALVDRIPGPLSPAVHLSGLTTELDTFRLEGTDLLSALARKYPM